MLQPKPPRAACVPGRRRKEGELGATAECNRGVGSGAGSAASATTSADQRESQVPGSTPPPPSSASRPGARRSQLAKAGGSGEPVGERPRRTCAADDAAADAHMPSRGEGRSHTPGGKPDGSAVGAGAAPEALAEATEKTEDRSRARARSGRMLAERCPRWMSTSKHIHVTIVCTGRGDRAGKRAPEHFPAATPLEPST